MTKRLDGKVALITGAARGMGEATARLFKSEGAKVVILDVLEAPGRALAEELGDDVVFMRHDVTDESSWTQVRDEAVERFGKIDVLVNNAGTVHFSRIADTERTDLDRVLAVNLIGPFLGIKIIAAEMARHGSGSVINICSIAGMMGQNGTGAYVSSKWGLRGLTKTAALEFGHLGVRVNSIFPGGTNTAMANVLGVAESEMNSHFKGQPIQRIGRPSEIAAATLFLASDDASYMCGAELAVDGGLLLGPYNPALPGAPTP